MEAMIPGSQVLDEMERLDWLASWQPRGIDPDGWASADAGFTIPHHPDYLGVRVRIEVPPHTDPAGSEDWTITLAEGEPRPFHATPGLHDLELPVPGAGHHNVIKIHATGPDQRCYQVKEIEWLKMLGADPSAWRYPPPVWEFEIELTAPPEVRRPPWWRRILGG